MATGRRPARWLLGYAWFTTFLLFLVLVAGFVVTDTDSGRGCGGTWPLCNGRFIPTLALHAAIEFSHRVLSGVAGVLVLLFFLFLWRLYARRRSDLVWAAFLGLLGVLAQAALGALNVLFPESATVLAFHFGVSLIAFSGVALATILLAQLSHRPPAASPDSPVGWTWRTVPAPPSVRAWVIVTLAYAYGVVWLGAYLAHVGTGLLCEGWPLCRGSLFPGFGGPWWLPFLHRVTALLLVLLLGQLVHVTAPLKARRPDLRNGAHLAATLGLLQVLSGAYLVFSRLSLGASLLHVSLMIVLFTNLAYLLLQVLPEPASRSA